MYIVIQIFQDGTTEVHRGVTVNRFMYLFHLEEWIERNKPFAHEYCIALIVEN